MDSLREWSLLMPECRKDLRGRSHYAGKKVKLTADREGKAFGMSDSALREMVRLNGV